MIPQSIKKITSLASLLLLFGFLSYGQNQKANESKSYSFTLDEAVNFALANNANLKNAKIDLAISKQTVKEVRSIGLPQVNANLGLTNNAIIPVQVFPNFINSALPPGSPKGPDFIEAAFGVNWSQNNSINLNQLIFDGTFFLGLKAASQYVELSQRILQGAEVDIRAGVTKSYYFALVNDYAIQLMQENLKTLDSSYRETKLLVETGFAELLDLERLEFQISNLKLQLKQFEDLKINSQNNLKLLLGLNFNDNLELKDNLENLGNKAIELNSTALDVNNRPEMRTINQQIILNQMDVKRYKYAYLPKINGNLNYQQNTFGTNFSDMGKTYYEGLTWGLSVQVPIFSGGYRSSQVKKAELNLEKTLNNKYFLENQIQNEVNSSRLTYIRAKSALEVQNQNLKLASRIKESTLLKYQNGLGSNLEYITAVRDYTQAQVNYMNAVYDLLIAEIDYKKALGIIK